MIIKKSIYYCEKHETTWNSIKCGEKCPFCKLESMTHNAVLGEDWLDADKHKPEYYKKLLLFIEENYRDFPSQNVKYIISGYFHNDNVYCDYSGQTINGEERVLKWTEEPVLV